MSGDIITALSAEEDENNALHARLRYLLEYAGYYAGLPLPTEAVEGIRPFLIEPEQNSEEEPTYRFSAKTEQIIEDWRGQNLQFTAEELTRVRALLVRCGAK